MSTLSAGLGLIRSLPLSLARAASRLILLLYLALAPAVRREINLNYHRVFARYRRWFWIRQAWRLGGNLALMSRLGRPGFDNTLDKTRIIGENMLEQIMLGDKSVIVLSLHYGAWELLPQIFARRGYQVCVGAGRQQDNQFGARSPNFVTGRMLPSRTTSGSCAGRWRGRP